MEGSADVTEFSRQYETDSFAKDYLDGCCLPNPWVRFDGDDDGHPWFLKELNDAFQRLPDGLGTLLDFGAGPSIVNAYLAAPKFSKIILSEYADGNRAELKKWFTGSAEDAAWEYRLKRLSDYAGITFDETRLPTLKDKVSAVIPCNLLDDVIVPQESVQPGSLDGVVTTLAIEDGATSIASFERTIECLAQYLKPNGFLVQGSALGQNQYTVGNAQLKCLNITKDQVLQAVRKAGLEIVGAPAEFRLEKPVPTDQHCYGDGEGFLLFIAQKIA